MTAKETKIKEAYISAGVDWEQVKKSIGGNGWVIIHKYDENAFDWKPYFKDDEVETDYDDVCLWRPKSLAGIEDNNGWIKIESGSLLPTDEGVLYRIGFFKKDGKFHQDENAYKLRTAVDALNDLYTHYQPILKPKPPIY